MSKTLLSQIKQSLLCRISLLSRTLCLQLWAPITVPILSANTSGLVTFSKTFHPPISTSLLAPQIWHLLTLYTFIFYLLTLTISKHRNLFPLITKLTGSNPNNLRTQHSSSLSFSMHPYTRSGIISGTLVTFCRNSGNYSLNLMTLSALWTVIICIPARTKILTLPPISALRYLAKNKQ